MSIPFSGQPVRYNDPETGVCYLLKPPVGETEISLMELAGTLPKNEKERREFFSKNHREASKFIDSSIDILLCGWETKKSGVKLPPFPSDSRPSQLMKSDLKMKIMSFYNSEKDLSEADLKN
jgi:hypothetical protein